MTWTFRLGVFLAAVGAVWSAWPVQDVDLAYAPAVAARTFDRPPASAKATAGRRPRVLIDEAHFNVHTESGRFAPFARLLERDGYLVGAFTAPFSAASLERCDVLVVANALGMKGVLQHAANLARLERYVDLEVRAFALEEIQVVEAWVRAGGRLLLVADHAPAGEAAADLAAAFGVRMRGWWIEDAEHTDPALRNPGFLLFSRENGLLLDSPISRGRAPGERIERVMTFTGQALEIPGGAIALLRLSSAAREYPDRGPREREGRSAAGLAQAVALRHGAGRVVMVGEAAALTAQQTTTPNGDRVLFGMNRPGNDNRQFVLNVMHWLCGLLDP